MEQRVDSGEAMRDGTMAEGGSEHARRPFPRVGSSPRDPVLVAEACS
jgi:hypothetical protein